MYKKKIIPLSVPDLKDRDVKFVVKSIKDGWVSSAGPLIANFEKKLKVLCKRREAIATINGSAALFISIKALNLPKGSFIVVPDWTFAATANAVIQAGHIPIFLDINSLFPVIIMIFLF